MSVWMSAIEFSLTTTIRGSREATRPCIRTNEYQRPTASPLASARCLLHLQHAVAGDRVVEGGDRRDPPLDGEDAVAEALVVVDQVELAGAGRQLAQGAVAEGERLGEGARAELGDLEEVPRAA